MGMDEDAVRAISRICADALLPRLFREFLRWQTLCDEGRVAANGSMHVAAILPELVSAALPVRLRNVPLRGRLARQVQALGSRHADADPSAETCVRVCGGHTRKLDEKRAARTALEIFV